MDVPRPARTVNLAAKLKDTANSEAAQLSFQRKAVQDFHTQQAIKNNPSAHLMGANLNPPASVTVSSFEPVNPQNKRSILSINDSDDEDGIIDQHVPRMSRFPPMMIMFSFLGIFL